MHSAKNIKFAAVLQTKQINKYENIKEKLCKVKATIWCNKTSSRLPEDKPSVSKHVEDIKKLKNKIKLKILIKEMCILLV